MADPAPKTPEEYDKAMDELDKAIRTFTPISPKSHVLSKCSQDVQALWIRRSLLPQIPMYDLISELPGLHTLSVSGNHLGPQGFQVGPT